MKYSAETYKAVRLLFAAYRQHDDAAIKVYAAMLDDVPVGLLQKTVKKCITESKFLPSIAEIRVAAQSLMAMVDPSRKVKTWQEAQKEISQGMVRTWYKGCLGDIPMDHPEYGQPCEPYWTTKEIEMTVKSYGWDNLMLAMADDMPTIWAQLRRLYEQACQSKAEREVNEYVLGSDSVRLKEVLQRALPGEKQ